MFDVKWRNNSCSNNNNNNHNNNNNNNNTEKESEMLYVISRLDFTVRCIGVGCGTDKGTCGGHCNSLVFINTYATGSKDLFSSPLRLLYVHVHRGRLRANQTCLAAYRHEQIHAALLREGEGDYDRGGEILMMKSVKSQRKRLFARCNVVKLRVRMLNLHAPDRYYLSRSL